MDVHISLAGTDLAASIYRQLLDAILDGRLRAGDRLPPTRELAGRLDVSRNTVAAAYERLAAGGFLLGRAGAGTFVGTTPQAPTGTAPQAPTGTAPQAPTGTAPQAPTGTAPQAPTGTDVVPLAIWRSGLPPAPTGTAPAPAYDFRVGTPDAGLFPIETWRRLVARELRPSALRAASYGDPAGHAGLRAAIARHVGVSRSVRARADDVLVTSGAQQALDLIGRVLLEPGASVAVEEPGYVAARLLFRSLGARVVPVPVDGDGLDVAALPADARLVYVTPSHQFPLGTPMTLARRAALLAWAAEHRAVVVEDDYDSEFRFCARPLEPLQSLDRGGRVIYVGSFSKTMLPMLRIGFLVGPPSLFPALRAAKQLSDWHGEFSTQAALAGFLDEGLLARHVRKATRAYAVRRDLVLAALDGPLGEWLVPVPSVAGLHVAARLRPHATVSVPAVPAVPAVLARAAAAGVAVEDLAGYHAGAPRPGLVIGYGAVDPAGAAEGLRRLAAAFHAEDRAAGRIAAGRAAGRIAAGRAG